MFKLIPFPYNLIAAAIAIAAFCGACWYAWHEFTGHYVDIGVAQEHVHTAAAEAANTTLAVERDTLKAQLAGAKAAGAAEVKRIADEKAKNAAAAAAKQKTLQAEVDQLAAQSVAPPAPTKELACENTNSLLDEYSARRLRD